MVRPGGARSGGQTLVEVAVALMVLEVGSVAVVGLLVEAGREVRRAAETERGAGEAAAVVDSLLDAGSSSPGTRWRGGIEVRWWVEGERLRVEAGSPADTVTPPVRWVVPWGTP